MHDRPAHITEEILSAQSAAGDRYALVTFLDGNVGVTKNGQPLPVQWSLTEEGMRQCTEYFLRLAESR